MNNTCRTLLTEMAAELDWSHQRLMGNRKATHPLADRARVLLDKPEPPADAEVTELRRRLKELADAVTKENWREFDMRVPAEPLRDADLVLTRAADLLQHQHPQPVAVSERLPGQEDCDKQGRCWLCGKVEGDWRLLDPKNSGVPQLKYCFSHWLPATALPWPAGN